MITLKLKILLKDTLKTGQNNYMLFFTFAKHVKTSSPQYELVIVKLYKEFL